MGTVRASLAEYLRLRRVRRAQIRATRDAARDRSAADELQRAREGINRFPPTGI